jgi:hypothetical protein
MPEKRKQEGWNIFRDEEHNIHNVTPDMIDWWFDNMEKGYALWHPSDHKGFEWEISPAKVGHVGAVQLATQRQSNEPLMKVRIQWDDVSLSPIPLSYEHVLIGSRDRDADGNPVDMVIHQYEAASYGTHHRHTVVTRGPIPMVQTQSKPSHSDLEAARWSEFLPELYKMWQTVTDPEINVPCCLKVKKMSNGKWAYVAKNKPLTQ